MKIILIIIIIALNGCIIIQTSTPCEDEEHQDEGKAVKDAVQKKLIERIIKSREEE